MRGHECKAGISLNRYLIKSGAACNECQLQYPAMKIIGLLKQWKIIVGGMDSMFNRCKHIQERDCVILHVLVDFFSSSSSVGYLLYANNGAKFLLEVVITQSCFCRF